MPKIAAAVLENRQHRRSQVGRRGRRQVGMVLDSQAPAQVDSLHLAPRSHHGGSDVHHLAHRLGKGRDVQNLRADVAVQAHGLYSLQAHGPPVGLGHLLRRYAELGGAKASGDLGVGLGGDIGIDPEEDLRLPPHSLRGLCEMLQLLARVHGHAHPRLDGHLVILLALGVAVVEDHIPGDAGHAHHGKLPCRKYISAHAFLGSDAEQCEVAVGLHCEVLVCFGKSAVVGANILAQAPLGGDVKRGALLASESKAVYVFEKEMIIARGEMRFRSEHDLNGYLMNY